MLLKSVNLAHFEIYGEESDRRIDFMKVLHVAIGTYPTSENPIAGIFVKKLVEMQRSKGLDSRVINGINSWFGFLKSGFSLNAERFTFTNQRGISRLPKLVQERYFSRLSAAFKKQCNFMPDVIHCHFANNAPLGQKLSLEFDCPYVVTLHENHWWFEEIIINDAQKYMSAITGSDIITRPNSIDLIDLYKWNIPYEKLMYLPNYVDEDSFRISSEAERTRARNELRIRRDKVILNIASLDKNKGQELLIISTSVLKKKLPSFEVWIIGEGPEEKALRDLSAQLGVQEDIKFLGRVENNKLQSYLSCADVFAMPSVNRDRLHFFV